MAGRFPNGSEAPIEFRSVTRDRFYPNDFEPPEPGEIDTSPMSLDEPPQPYANVGYANLKRR